MRSKLVATGSYLPERVVANEDLTQFPAASLPLIEQKTGVRQRRHAAEGQCTSDLGIEAGRTCLERAGVAAAELDAIVLATSSPDRVQPATATRVQEALGAKGAFAFDINSVCAGSVYAVHVADSMIRAGSCRTVLVIGAEVYSRYLNPRDFSTYPYFGDGAGAVLLQALEADAGGIERSLLGTDGAGADVIQVPAGGTMLPFAQMQRPTDACFKMKGRPVYEFAVTRGSEVVRQLLEACDVPAEAVRWVLSHQANTNIIDELSLRLGIARDRFVVNLDRYGNTAAASVFIALDELVASGRPTAGDTIVLVAFGGGLSWGATLLRI
jgi:3-oxoacyl-[acyl-carrier-protein] synthase-3